MPVCPSCKTVFPPSLSTCPKDGAALIAQPPPALPLARGAKDGSRRLSPEAKDKEDIKPSEEERMSSVENPSNPPNSSPGISLPLPTSLSPLSKTGEEENSSVEEKADLSGLEISLSPIEEETTDENEFLGEDLDDDDDDPSNSTIRMGILELKEINPELLEEEEEQNLSLLQDHHTSTEATFVPESEKEADPLQEILEENPLPAPQESTEKEKASQEDFIEDFISSDSIEMPSFSSPTATFSSVEMKSPSSPQKLSNKADQTQELVPDVAAMTSEPFISPEENPDTSQNPGKASPPPLPPAALASVKTKSLDALSPPKTPVLAEDEKNIQAPSNLKTDEDLQIQSSLPPTKKFSRKVLDEIKAAEEPEFLAPTTRLPSKDVLKALSFPEQIENEDEDEIKTAPSLPAFDEATPSPIEAFDQAKTTGISKISLEPPSAPSPVAKITHSTVTPPEGNPVILTPSAQTPSEGSPSISPSSRTPIAGNPAIDHSAATPPEGSPIVAQAPSAPSGPPRGRPAAPPPGRPAPAPTKKAPLPARRAAPLPPKQKQAAHSSISAKPQPKPDFLFPPAKEEPDPILDWSIRLPSEVQEPGIIFACAGEKDIAVCWHDRRNKKRYEVFIALFGLQGQKRGPAVSIVPKPGPALNPCLAWDGTGFGLFWQDGRKSKADLYYRHLSPEAKPEGKEIRLTRATGDSMSPRVVWNGESFTVVYAKQRGEICEIYLIRVSREGKILGDGEVQISEGNKNALNPYLIHTDNGYAVVWEDFRNDRGHIYFTRLDPNGGRFLYEQRISFGKIGTSNAPSVAHTGKEFGIAWIEWPEDTRQNNAIHFCRVDNRGHRIGEIHRIITERAIQAPISLLFLENEFLVIWQDSREGMPQIFAQRINTEGIRLGGEIRLSNGEGAALYPWATSTGTGVASTWHSENPKIGAYELFGSMVILPT